MSNPPKTSPPATPAVDAKGRPVSFAPRRPSAFAAWRRRFRQRFPNERLRELGTTLALVAPLTVLIWVWAEREEIPTSPEHKQFYVTLRSSDPGKMLSITDAPGGRISVDLTGPRAGIDQLNEAIDKDQSKVNLTLDVDELHEVGGPYEVALAPLIDKQKFLTDLGLTVGRTAPEKVHVLVDRQVERELAVKLPPELVALVQSATIEPAAVHVRGPERILSRLEGEGALKAELDLTVTNSISTARPGEQVSLEKINLKPLPDDSLKFDAPIASKVTLQVSSEEQGEIPLMAVYVAQPAALNVRVHIDPPTLTKVKIVGRGDVLKRLAAGGFEQRPYAELTFTPDDVGQKGRRVPAFRNMPAGVRVVDGSVPEISFDATEATPVGP